MALYSEQTRRWIYEPLPSHANVDSGTMVSERWTAGDGADLCLMRHDELCKALGERGYSGWIHGEVKNTVK
jgi:hypothetical protein